MLEVIIWFFLISASIQFTFFFAISIALFTYRIPKSSEEEIKGITVVVCAKNELKNLRKLLPKLLVQDYPNFELILVDDKSTDETYDYAIQLEQQVENFKLIRIDNTPDHINNKKYAVTLGVSGAKYEHILLTDADCIPESNQWISQMSHGYGDSEKVFILGYSQYLKRKGWLNAFIRYETLLTGLNYIGIGLLGNPYMGVGRNLSYRKSSFLELKGFNRFQHVVGGDDDLLVNQYAKRRNTSIVISPETMIWSYPKESLHELYRQKIRHLSVGKLYKMTDKLLLSILSFTKILFWFSFFAAIMSGYQVIFVSGVFFLVMVSLLTSILSLKRKTGDDTCIWTAPILEVVYIFYYLSTGLKVLFTKKVRWS